MPQAGHKTAAAAGRPDGQDGCLVTGSRSRGLSLPETRAMVETKDEGWRGRSLGATLI